MAEITIIVPVYRVENCLPRCVESILDQSFSDFRLILVDDGSPDGSPALCDAYARRDDRIHVIHQKNAGAAAARNAGLAWAEINSPSPWLCFVDSDDWVHPRLLEYLHTAALEHPGKISVCRYLETAGEEVLPENPPYQVEIWQSGDFYQTHYINATVPWGKLYPSALFSGQRYPEGKYLDDEFLTYRLLFAGESLAVIPQPLYAYYSNPQGLTKCGWNPKLLYAWEAYEAQIAFFSQRGDEAMVKFRYEDYLDSGKQQLSAAKAAPNAAELAPVIRKMKRQLRRMVRRAWGRGYIHFWADYEFLKELAPVQAKLYRFWLDR